MSSLRLSILTNECDSLRSSRYTDVSGSDDHDHLEVFILLMIILLDPIVVYTFNYLFNSKYSMCVKFKNTYFKSLSLKNAFEQIGITNFIPKKASKMAM